MTVQTAEAAQSREPADLRVFASVKAWVFDLDNTLYPRSTNLFRQVDERIRAFVRRLLDVDEAEAERIQKTFYREHGTTLRGLMIRHDVDPDAFLEFVHDIDHSVVPADPALGDAILRLPGRKYIFTNGSRRHAERVAARLGFAHHFEDIFDIVEAEFVPKPERATYDRFVARYGIAPEQTAMFEDLARNLVVPKALGMTTVLVVPPGTREVFHGEWDYEGRDDDHVDFVTDDLAAFLGRVADAIGAP
jgi:putative hydrolase of the HAD superfamily